MALHRFSTTLLEVTAGATVANSQEILYGEYTSGEVHIASGSVITELTWYSAPKAGGTYEPAQDYDGVAVTQTVAAGKAYPIPLALFGNVAIKAVATAGTKDRAITCVDATDSSLRNTTKAPTLSYPCSLECWVKGTEVDIRGIFSMGTGTESRIALYTASAGEVFAQVRWDGVLAFAPSTVPAYIAINDDAWHHLVGVMTATEVELYVDGVASGSPGANALPFPNMDHISIGHLTSETEPKTDIFDGAIDECRVWDLALTQADVTALYNGGAGLLSTLITGRTPPFGKRPIHAYPCSVSHADGVGADVGSVGGIPLSLTTAGAVGDVEGNPAAAGSIDVSLKS